jgi:hypothetical protein
VKFESIYIGQWALANEEIPAHIIWDREEKVDTIIIELPDELQFSQAIGVNKFSVKDSNVIINGNDLIAPNYFAFVVKSARTFNEINVIKTIRVKFFSDNHLIGEKILNAKIVRPLIRIKEAPNEIIIDDKTNRKRLLDIVITHSGLGTAVMEVDVMTGGDVISLSDSLYFEILKDIAERVWDDSNLEHDYDEFQVEQHFVEDMTYEVIKKMDRGDLPLELDKQTLHEIKEVMQDSVGREKMTKLIYSRIHRLMVAALLYYFDRRPHEDIEIPLGKIKTLLRPEMREISLLVKYKDSLGNEYEPEKHVIQINDLRMKKEKFEAPLNIKFESKPFRAGD